MRIALDIHGGDSAPVSVLEGAVKALKELRDIELILVGREKEISLYFKNRIPDRLSICSADTVIEDTEKPLQAIKEKWDSSIVKGINLLKEKKAEVFVSAGSSGAVMAAATLLLGRMEEISRPALLSVFPTLTGEIVIIDVGANTSCKVQNLVEFALMGKIYAKEILEIEEPRIGLLSNGHEENKGTELIQQANIVLKEKEKNFIGNIEGRDVMYGKADVIVCDGFTGNIVLKFAEGLALSIYEFMKMDLKKHPINWIGVLFLSNLLRRFKKKIDWRQHGGAPLLGVNGNVIIGHGSSDSFAILNSIKAGYRFVKKDILEKIKRGVS